MKPIEAWRHVPHESLGTLEATLGAAGFECRYVDWWSQPPARFDPHALAGIVVLGGPMNVDETHRYPFLATEVEWIRRAVDAQLPVLGICLGSQLLAKALGARVYANGVKEIGWYRIHMTEAAALDPLFSACAPSETVFQWHGDTFDLPAGAVHLAESDACRNQAYRYGASAYGLQFHLEVTPEMVTSWLAEPENCGELATLPEIDAQEILQRTPREVPGMRSLADQVFRRFALLCLERGLAGP